MGSIGGQADYKIGKATGVCEATGRRMNPGEPCIAALCEREDDQGFDRRDYSLEAWEAGKRPDRLFSYWKTTVMPPETNRRALIDDAALMDLFERLADDDRPQRQAFRFVLGLILMRKKALKFAGRKPGPAGSAEKWLVQAKGAADGTPPMELVNPNLSEDDVLELTSQLGEILQSEV